MDDNSYSPAFGNGSDFQSAPPSLRRSFFFSLYSLIWIAATVASSLYVQQRDGAGWPVAIWAVQMLLMGFVQIPAVIYSRRWLVKNELLGKFPRTIPAFIAFSILVLTFVATFFEVVIAAWAIITHDKLSLHESTRLGFLFGLIISPIPLLLPFAFVGFIRLLASLFYLVAYFATRAGSKVKYRIACPFCEGALPLELPRMPQEKIKQLSLLPPHVLEADIRQCPHCAMPILPVSETSNSSPWRHLNWAIFTLMVTLPVALRDGWGWTTALWAIEVWLIPYGFVPAGLKIYAWLCGTKPATHFNDQPLWKQAIFSAFLIGMPLGAFFGVVFCLIYNWKIPIHFAGQLGLLIGPLVVGWCIFQASVVCGVILLLGYAFRSAKAFFAKN
ncbi:MAG: hypothetical protein ACO1RA_20700 [Planctomycetaceae bacterium]